MRCSCVSAVFVFLLVPAYLSGSRAYQVPSNRWHQPSWPNVASHHGNRGHAAWGRPAVPYFAPPHMNEGIYPESQPAWSSGSWPQLRGRSAAINQEEDSSPSISEEPKGSESSAVDVIAARMTKLLDAVEDIRGKKNQGQELQ